MNALWTLVTFELRRHWLALPGGLLVGLLALVAPHQERLVIAFLIASLAAYLVSFVLGLTVLASDLFAGRIGFYLNRPIPGWTLWTAKMLTGSILAAGVLVLGLLPALLTGGSGDPLAAFAGETWGSFATAFLA